MKKKEKKRKYWMANVDMTCLQGYAHFVDRQVVVDSLLPCVQSLVSDESEQARAALAKEISGLAPILGQDA